MRLTKVKLAGFKSFVDPTTVSFPSNLTGVVGPNGCGKSNIIDAVRWVMGELSARHLRGDSMADVIFNGSSARKPVGNASVELTFDNSDGKITGPYANYNEISLKRVVSRDGNSGYFINGARCRRKDITTLFLGTGLGARGYSIIEQGMISRVIEARGDEMRNFVEEAAGISRYKERRRETEARISDTRENLDRLQDLRDEVDKQIRHLQRQATVARKYQDLRNEETRLGAELLALRLRDIDRGAEVKDRSVRDGDLRLQQALADQRSAEAAVEKQREFHAGAVERTDEVQRRYYTQGAETARLEQSLNHMRELREQRRAELGRTQSMLAETSQQVERDRQRVDELGVEIESLAPLADDVQQQERRRAEERDEAEHAEREWQQRWEEFNRRIGRTQQTTQVERARIEQLEDQLRRLGAQADRLAIEQEQLAAVDAETELFSFGERESAARLSIDELSQSLQDALDGLTGLRRTEAQTNEQLSSARAARERVRAELVSLEALQRAALGEAERAAGQWVAATGLGQRPRAAEQLSVTGGWERAVETVLGDALEAISVDALEGVVGRLGELRAGQVTFIEGSAGGASGANDSLSRLVTGPAAVVARLGSVRTAGSLAEALARRGSLAPGESLVTAAGEWVGPDWLRVVRGSDGHSGVLEREQRIKKLRQGAEDSDAAVHELEDGLRELRERQVAAERARDAVQASIQAAHRGHSEALRLLEAARGRSQQAAARRERLAGELAEVAAERERAQGGLSRAREAYEAAAAELEVLDGERHELEAEREERRAATGSARQAAQQAQQRARELLIQLEGRRSSLASMQGSLARLTEQNQQLTLRQTQLVEELRDGDEPVRALAAELDEALARRLEVEAELTAARRDLDAADAELRSLDERRLTTEQRVGHAREELEAARLAAQESRLRREAIAEQFAATRFDLEEVTAALATDCDPLQWEDRLRAVQADLQRLGQVNLAAIDELKEQTERKTYLDSQWQDLTDALDVLDQAMRKIDKETRSRFEDTFNRINTGLKEKFPRLFGGGHAYLELVGDDVLSAGVAVMARPPGKRNSTISQLSGGEKALTAVALVFSIFDLNPAPFCLLDEVDAPLDENNVGRFCDIVRDMSDRVQFIFITHNKTTMELAEQLVGVTQNEPGVSRMVAVDVAEAVRLAAV
jgi:chromosome segregation protein